MKSSAKIIVAFAALAIAAGAAFAVFRSESAPEVRFVTLSGGGFSASGLHSRVVLVNFWATSCAICVAETPMLVETHRKFAARGFGGIVGTPTAFVPDRRGRVVKRYLGQPDRAELQALIERTLAG